MDERNTAPTSSNPSHYERAVRVEDDEALLLKTQLDEKSRQVRRLQQHLDVALAEGNALKERMFLRLDETYPSVRGVDPQVGVGVRQWEEGLWYVAWDSQPGRSDERP